MSTNTFDFRIDPNNYMGIEHEEYKTNLLQLALTKPTEYFELRKTVLANVKRASVAGIYETYYRLLTNGSSPADTNDASLANKNPIFQPCLPRQKVNEFALKASKTIDAISEEAIDLILPMDYKRISDSRSMQHTAGNLGFATGNPISNLVSAGGGGGSAESKSSS